MNGFGVYYEYLEGSCIANKLSVVTRCNQIVHLGHIGQGLYHKLVKIDRMLGNHLKHFLIN